MNRSKFTSANNYQIDSFIEYYDIQTSEFPEIEELQGLLRKQDKSEIEITRQNTLKTKYNNRIPSAEQFNYFCDCLINMETFISTQVMGIVNGKQKEITDFMNAKQLETTAFIDEKKVQIETTQGQVTSAINATRDGALQTIEDKKATIIAYMDDTTAGAIRNDLGVKGELQTSNKDNLVNAINEINRHKQSITDATLKTTDKTIVGAINENKESIRLSNIEISDKQPKIDSGLGTTSKVVVSAINELNFNKQDKMDDSLKTYNKAIIGAINENTTDIDLISKNVSSMNNTVDNLDNNKQNKTDNALKTVSKTIVGGINNNFIDLALLGDRVSKIIEAGENYIKFDNGKAICWIQQTSNFPITASYGNAFYCGWSYFYPVILIDVPTQTISCESNGAVTATIKATTNRKVDFWVLSPKSETLNVKINIIAIGKWK